MSSTYYGAKEGSDVYKPEYDRPKKKEEDNVIRKEDGVRLSDFPKLSQNNIDDLKKKGFSEANISKAVQEIEDDEFVECDECGEEATAYVDANLCDECFDDKDTDGDGVIENENKNDDNDDDDYVPSSSGGGGTFLSLVIGLFVMGTIGLVMVSMMGSLTDTFDSSTNGEYQMMSNVTTAFTSVLDVFPLFLVFGAVTILVVLVAIMFSAFNGINSAGL